MKFNKTHLKLFTEQTYFHDIFVWTLIPFPFLSSTDIFYND